MKKKTARQLDADIAHALARRPIEAVHIPAESRRELNKFWRAHPTLRRGCVSKYGFDPIDHEAMYWRFGLAESDHKETLRAVRKNKGVFSLVLVKRWEKEELADA